MAFSVKWKVHIPKPEAQAVLEVFDAYATVEITNAQKIVQETRAKVWFKYESNFEDNTMRAILDYASSYFGLYRLIEDYVERHIIQKALELKKTKFSIDAEEILEAGLRSKIRDWFAKHVAKELG